MIGLFRLAVTFAVALSAVSTEAAAPAALVATGKWNVDFAAHQCTASRNYGTKEKPLILVLKPPPMGDVMQVAIIRNGKGGDALQIPAKLTIDQHRPIDLSLLAFTAKSQARRIGLVNLPLETSASMRNATTFSISAANEVTKSFTLTQMPALMKEMDRCMDDLKRVWNVGEANSKKLTQGARSQASLATYFSHADYPLVALGANQSGVVQFALLIDEAGRIADCTVVATSGIASLDAQTCAVMSNRARFIPAIGIDGKPAKAALAGRIRWELPND